MPPIRFTKAHAAGNDFILIADPNDELELSPARVAALCDRHTGIGADGVIRAVRSERLAAGRAVLDTEPESHWFLDARRADGTDREAGGNSIRAFARFLTERCRVELAPGDTLPVATRAGVRDVQRTGTGGFQVDLGRWQLGDEPEVAVAGLDVARPGLSISIGEPYVVVALAHADELDALNLTAHPTLTPAPEGGASVVFVLPQEPLVRDGVGWLWLRAAERGVGETRSSGTGAAAAALAVRHWAGAGAPHHWRVDAAGGAVQVRMFPTEEGEHLGIAGPSELVFDGQLAGD